MKRLKTFIANLQSTERLLAQLSDGSRDAALAALEILKERKALQDGSLQNRDLCGVNLSGATFAKGKLNGINLSRAQLVNTYFFDAQLQAAKFEGAMLKGANLRAAHMQNASFSAATMERANLSRADLSGADMRDTNLKFANFWQTRLCGANLAGANLTSATVIDVHCDEQTVLPDGGHWSPDVDWSAYTHG